MIITREEIIEALRDEVKSWGKQMPGQVAVPARFLADILQMLEVEEDDGK